MVFKDFSLREASNADIPSIKKVVFGVLEEYALKGSETGKDLDLSDVENNYLSNNGYFGVAVELVTGRIVGTFGLYRIDASSCELRKMYVLKSARGKGLGDFIVKFAIQKAKDLGYSRMMLETISPLKEAISLYKKHGFKEIPPKELSDRVDQAFELKL
jgi:putative acetyltransferase